MQPPLILVRARQQAELGYAKLSLLFSLLVLYFFVVVVFLRLRRRISYAGG